ncbi:MAG: hypothetical protein QW500_03890 [Candidatus Micrarchaeia archaeon]
MPTKEMLQQQPSGNILTQEEQMQMFAQIEKVQAYLNALKYLTSIKKSAEYYLKTTQELRKESPQHIQLIAAEENCKSVIKQVDHLIKELNESSLALSAYEIKDFVLNRSKQAYELNLKTKKFLDDYLKNSPWAMLKKEAMRTAAESVPVVGGPVAVTTAMLDYDKAVKEGENASLARINLYIVGALMLIPGGAASIKLIKKLNKGRAVEKLFGLKSTEEVIRRADDFVKQIPAEVTDKLEVARKSIPYHTESIFKSLEKVDGSLDMLVKKYANIEEIAKDGCVYVLDKSGTWLLNGIDTKAGDLGLLVYFEAMKKLSNKGLYVVRITEKGDEVVILGRKGLEKEIQGALKESAKEVFKRYGIKSSLGFEEKCAKASILSTDIVIREGKVMYKSAGKEVPFSLSELINDAEIQHSLKSLSDSEKKIVYNFVDGLRKVKLMKKSPPERTTGLQIKVLYEFEDPKMQNALKKITESNNKAVHQANLNLIGPSTANQFGHINADSMTAAAFDALVSSGKITKEEAKAISQKAALTYSIESDDVAKNLSRINGLEIKAIVGNTKVKLRFFVGTADEIDDIVTTAMLSRMGVNEDTIKQILPRVKDINRTIARLHMEGADISPWTRDSIAMLHYFMSY